MFRQVADERPDRDSGDDVQSEETGDADDTKDMVAHDTQVGYRPSFFPDSAQ